MYLGGRSEGFGACARARLFVCVCVRAGQGAGGTLELAAAEWALALHCMNASREDGAAAGTASTSTRGWHAAGEGFFFILT